MTDVVIVKQGSKELDGTEIINIPVKYIDNGDGTYSEAGSGGSGGAGDASAAKQDAQTALLQSLFTLASEGYSLETTQLLIKALLTSIDSVGSNSNVVLQSINSAAQNTLATVAKQDIAKAVLDAIKVAQTISKVTAQTLSLGLASTQSSVVSSTTKRVVLTSSMDCWVDIGANPTATLATGASFFLAAGIPSYPMDVVSSTSKIAVIAPVANGYLSIIESL